MNRFDEKGNVERKFGSGRPRKLTQNELKRLKALVNNKTGVSQRKLAKKFDVSQKNISNNLKKTGIFYRKRKRAPKANPAQKQRQTNRLQILCSEDGLFGNSNSRDIALDDESYFTMSGAGMPGNSGFYSYKPENAPEDVKFKFYEKFPEKVMIWGVISSKGIGELYIAPQTRLNGL